MVAGAGKFVIIVDDDNSSAEVLGQFLRFMGLEYHVTANGGDIVELLMSFSKVDIIFLDLDLSIQSGYDVLKIIRGSKRWDAIPVVGYTSHTDQKSQAREAGFHSFLSKPLDSNAFPQQLENILSNEHVWD